VVFSSRVDLIIASWARSYKDNGAHPGSKKGAIFAEILRIRLAASVSSWSICDLYFFMYVICLSLWEPHTKSCGMVPYHIASYHTGVPPDKLITGTDPYVGYCIPHTDQYHVNKHIMSFFAFSVKALIIKIIRRKRSN
jgi:hypothetical protein